jgi:nitronate monooxygenase
MLALGASAVSIGTRFIASTEATVPESYKQAVLDSGMSDIVMTERLSGTPCTIINTSYAQKIGYTQNAFEKWLGKNETTRKYFKMMVQLRGLKKLEQAVKPGNYRNLWCAGKSVELIDAVRSCSEIVRELELEMEQCMTRMATGFNSQ